MYTEVSDKSYSWGNNKKDDPINGSPFCVLDERDAFQRHLYFSASL